MLRGAGASWGTSVEADGIILHGGGPGPLPPGFNARVSFATRPQESFHRNERERRPWPRWAFGNQAWLVALAERDYTRSALSRAGRDGAWATAGRLPRPEGRLGGQSNQPAWVEVVTRGQAWELATYRWRRLRWRHDRQRQHRPHQDLRDLRVLRDLRRQPEERALSSLPAGHRCLHIGDVDR